MFIAEKGEGFIVAKKMKKLGYRAIDTCELVFQDYRVPADCLLGGEEGRGFQHAVGGLELGRINIAARGAGIAEGALRMAVRYAQERKTFGKPICEHQAIQLKLGEMAARVEAAKLLVESAARAYDTGQRCDMEAGMAKYFATETGVFCAQEAMRIFGGYSYSTEYEIERFYRDAMLMCIGEGTNEMQRIIIAKQLVERNRI
jgi:butyryl-CoA dehydrogenase